MASKWKTFGIAAVIAFIVALLYRRRRVFRGARGFILLFHILVAIGEAWREARYRRRLATINIQALPYEPGPGPGPA